MLDVTVTKKGGPAETAKRLPAILSEANASAIRHWHRRMLPGHFRPGAGQTYKYAPRDKKYVQRKLRKQGHRRPLEWEGKLKRSLRQRLSLRTYKTRARARGTMRGTAALNLWSGPLSQKRLARPRKQGGVQVGPNLRREILATTRAEQRALAERVEADAARRVNDIGTLTRKKLT